MLIDCNNTPSGRPNTKTPARLLVINLAAGGGQLG